MDELDRLRSSLKAGSVDSVYTDKADRSGPDIDLSHRGQAQY